VAHFPSRAAAVAAAAATVLAGCQAEAPAPRATPVFYQSLAGSNAPVDEAMALAMINEYRAKNGVAPLRLDPALSRIAAGYAAVMAAEDKRGHAARPGADFIARLREAGYPAIAAGENVAAGYYTLADAFNGWRGSPAHDRGMKDPEMTAMGIGVARNPTSKYKVFWSLIFARPRAEAAGTPGVGAVPTVVSAAGAPMPQPQ
jgi:uncharacterized protein YkwD